MSLKSIEPLSALSTYQQGACKHSLHAPSLLAACSPPVRTPVGAPLCTKCAEWGALLPPCSRHPTSMQTGNVGWNPKGAHPLSPLTPAHLNRTASVGPPTAPLILPPFMHNQGPRLRLNVLRQGLTDQFLFI